MQSDSIKLLEHKIEVQNQRIQNLEQEIANAFNGIGQIVAELHKRMSGLERDWELEMSLKVAELEAAMPAAEGKEL